jgi:transmembrane sensor
MNDLRLIEEAASWYLDMQESPDDRTRARFLNWLRHSPQHVAEYMAMAQMHGDLRAATVAETMSLGELQALAASESSVVALRGGVGGEHPSPLKRLPQGASPLKRLPQGASPLKRLPQGAPAAMPIRENVHLAPGAGQPPPR